ncbi:hypothetical protein KP509_05G079000 [Ceratopteris richardii]|uniref:OVATE domain-containing protein n=1 Tax=Ceratopteris richardii TaxID=49495 RepID=A0A8T2UN35_CERRI|nr:hypothetical protein KP509_05G079000 [Ceratopteris richardii]
MAPGVREKLKKRPVNSYSKPPIWQDAMVEVKETFRRIQRVKHSGFTLWDDRTMRSGPDLSRNRLARVKMQAPLSGFNLPSRTLREIENNRSQPPIVSFNHLQNLLGMCRRINAQSLLKERKKNPHDPCLYPVYLRRPVERTATPPRAPAPPPSSSTTPRRSSSVGVDQRRRSSTPPAASGGGLSQTPPGPNNASARKRPQTARPAVEKPPYAYAPRKFTLLLDISNRPAGVAVPPLFPTRPSSAASTPRPASSRSQKEDTLSRPTDQQASKKGHPHVPCLKKVPHDAGTPNLASDRTYDRSSQHSGSLSSFGPIAEAYFNQRPRSAGDNRPISAGEVHSKLPVSRGRAGPNSNRGKSATESHSRSLIVTDLPPQGSMSASPPSGLASPPASDSPNTGYGAVRAPGGGKTRAKTSSNVNSKKDPSIKSGSAAKERPPSRRGSKPLRKNNRKKGSATDSQLPLGVSTPADLSTMDGSDDNLSRKASEESTTKNADRSISPPQRTRSLFPENSDIVEPPEGMPRGMIAPPFIGSTESAEASITNRRSSIASKGPETSQGMSSIIESLFSSETTDESVATKIPEQARHAPAYDEPSPGRPKVSFAAPDRQEKKHGKEPATDLSQSPLDEALERLLSPRYTDTTTSSVHTTNIGHGVHRASGYRYDDGYSSERELTFPIDAPSKGATVSKESSDDDSMRSSTSVRSCSSSLEMQTECERDEGEESDAVGSSRTQQPMSIRHSTGHRATSYRGARNLRDALQDPLSIESEEEQFIHGEPRSPASNVFIKFSANAYQDFKNSMMNCIINDHLENAPDEELDNLFQLYIDLNQSTHHGVLHQVFRDVKLELRRLPRSSS